MRKLVSLVLGFLAISSALAQVPPKPPVLPVWASGATPTNDIVQPSNPFIIQGWPLSSTPPARQYFNWLENYTFNGIRYFSHRGIVDWDTAETYNVGDIVQRSDGLLFRSLQNSNAGNSPTFNTFWGSILVGTPANGDTSLNATNTLWVNTNYFPRTTLLSNISGQVTAGQVPLNTVQQYQANLSISYGQLTGVPVSTSATPNTILVRDAAGDVFSRYFNEGSPPNENPGVGQVIVNNTGDNYLRKVGFGNFQNQQNLANFGGQVTSAQVPAAAITQYSPQIFAYNPFVSKAQNGCSELPGGIIIMWGFVNPNGGNITVNFPCGGFPNAAFSVVATSTGTPTQSNITGLNRLQFSTSNTGGQSYYMAVGF